MWAPRDVVNLEVVNDSKRPQNGSLSFAGQVSYTPPSQCACISDFESCVRANMNQGQGFLVNRGVRAARTYISPFALLMQWSAV